MKPENSEKLGQLADSLDAILCTSKLPLPPHIHIEAMTSAVRDARNICAEIVVSETGDNPWADNPLSG
jgi:hypothetical protein